MAAETRTVLLSACLALGGCLHPGAPVVHYSGVASVGVPVYAAPVYVPRPYLGGYGYGYGGYGPRPFHGGHLYGPRYGCC